MAQKIDFISIRVTAFFIIIAWSVYATGSLLWGILMGIGLFIVLLVAYSYYDKKKKPYSYNQLALYLAMLDKPNDLIVKLIDPDIGYIREGNLIITRSQELIYTSFGFSTFGMSDMLKASHQAKTHNAKTLTIITIDYNKQIFNIISRIDIKVNIINIKQLMHLLQKNNLLPVIEKTSRNRITLSDIFNKQLAGRFLLCGAIIALMSILMPVKLYYLIISAICFIIGLVCLFTPYKSKNNHTSVLK